MFDNCFWHMSSYISIEWYNQVARTRPTTYDIMCTCCLGVIDSNASSQATDPHLEAWFQAENFVVSGPGATELHTWGLSRVACKDAINKAPWGYGPRATENLPWKCSKNLLYPWISGFDILSPRYKHHKEWVIPRKLPPTNLSSFRDRYDNTCSWQLLKNIENQQGTF